MSLWTPSGEHKVPRDEPDPPAAGGSNQAPPEAATGPSLEDMTPEQRAQAEAMAEQMEEARARMLEMPAGVVIGQQALQFYELAALYLSQDTPRLEEAQTAIDAFTAVIEKLGTRLDEAEDPLRQALNQLQLAYVEASTKAAS